MQAQRRATKVEFLGNRNERFKPSDFGHFTRPH